MKKILPGLFLIFGVIFYSYTMERDRMEIDNLGNNNTKRDPFIITKERDLSKDNKLGIIIKKYPKENRLHATLYSDLKSCYSVTGNNNMVEQNTLKCLIKTEEEIAETERYVSELNEKQKAKISTSSVYASLIFNGMVKFVLSKKELPKTDSLSLNETFKKEIQSSSLNSHLGRITIQTVQPFLTAEYEESDEQVSLFFMCIPNQRNQIFLSLKC